MFNLFDADGNKAITINTKHYKNHFHKSLQLITIEELLNMMAVFIEIGEGKNHKVILGKTLVGHIDFVQ